MGAIYLASLAAALGVLLLQIIAGTKSGADAHADLHADAHVGGEHVSHDADLHAAADHATAEFVALFLSTRFWIFAALAFGLSGSLIHFLSLAGTIATALIAGGAGLSSGVFAALAFRVVARASLSTSAAASDARGHVGRVLVACSRGRVGQVRVELKGNSVDFVATTDDDEIPRGAEVLVEDVRGGVLHVSKRPPELA